MKRTSFLSKLVAGYGALILLAILVVAMLGGNALEAGANEQILAGLRGQLELFVSLTRRDLARIGTPQYELDLARLAQGAEIRFTIIRPDGEVLADSSLPSAKLDNHAGRPEIAETMKTGLPASSVRHSASVGTDLMYFARLVDFGGGTRLVVRVSQPLDLVQQGRRRFLQAISIGAGLTLVLAIVGGFWFLRRVTEPLRNMTSVALSIAEGGYGERLRVTSSDEVGRLARAFNSMSEELEQRMETISTDRNKLVAILSSMVEGVVAIDQDERVLHLNQVASEMLDVPEGNQEGRPIWELTRIHEACAILARAMRERQDLSQELPLASLDGDRILVLRACPILDSGRDVVGAVLVLHDVTEESRFEVVRRDFVANVSHELKTPLTAIRGYVETMVDDQEMDGDTRARFLDRIRSQVMRLGTLVTDLLTLTRLDSREDNVEFQKMDLRQTVTESIHGLRGKAESKGLSLSLDLGEGAVQMVGDPEALRQLVDNIVGNAINYTPQGGWVRIRLSSDENQARLQVSDNGVGILPKDRERVFERFFRVDKARSRELGGTGLGLAIVKNVALAHGGSVSVDSELGRGSTFTVRLPLAGPES